MLDAGGRGQCLVHLPHSHALMARAYPINSSSSAVTVPGVNDYDLTRFPTNFLTEGW